MLGRLKDVFSREEKSSLPEHLKKAWEARCQEQMRIDAQVTFSSHRLRSEGFKEIEQKGVILIGKIIDAQGEEITTSLLEDEALEDLSIETQLEILSLAQSESPQLIISGLNSTPEQERKDWQYPRSRQDELFRKVLAGILEQVDKEDFNQVRRKVKNAGPIKGYKWERLLRLCRQRGSKFISDALDYIPPNQIVPEKIDRRLDLEKRLQESPEQPIERKFVFSGYVQDVGFRGHSLECAEEWGVTTGWVRNETDGTVTLVLQGEPSRLDLIIQELEKPETRQAELQEEKNLDETERLKEFDIKIAEGWVEAGW